MSAQTIPPQAEHNTISDLRQQIIANATVSCPEHVERHIARHSRACIVASEIFEVTISRFIFDYYDPPDPSAPDYGFVAKLIAKDRDQVLAPVVIFASRPKVALMEALWELFVSTCPKEES